MSTMFKAALEKHVNNLKARIAPATLSPEQEKEAAKIKELLVVAKDDKFRASLSKQLAKLSPGDVDAATKADVSKRITAASTLLELVKDHPEYNKTRKAAKKKK